MENMTGYSNSNSSLSLFPTIGTQYKFTENNPNFTDESSSLTVPSSQVVEAAVAQQRFAHYGKKIEAEKRMIKKVCEDEDLTDLILNLHKFKVLYRKRIREDELQKSKRKHEQYSSLLNPPEERKERRTDKNAMDKMSELKKQNRHYTKRIKELEKKISIIETLQTSAMNNLQKATQENEDLKSQIEKMRNEPFKSKFL